MISKISKLKDFGIFHDFTWKTELSDFKKFNLIYDWYVSGDTGENTWLEAKRKFKDKWFKGDRSERLKQIIDDRLTIVKEELEKIIFCTKGDR